MTAFAPIAGAAIADTGEGDIVLVGNNVITQNPTVGSTALVEQIVLQPNDVTLGNPTVATTAISQNHAVTGVYNQNGISVPTLTMFEDETFSAKMF